MEFVRFMQGTSLASPAARNVRYDYQTGPDGRQTGYARDDANAVSSGYFSRWVELYRISSLNLLLPICRRRLQAINK